MLNPAKRLLERAHPLSNHPGGIDVERRAKSFRKFGQRNPLAAQHRLPRVAFFARARVVSKSGRPLDSRPLSRWELRSFAHLRFAALPFTLIATTV